MSKELFQAIASQNIALVTRLLKDKKLQISVASEDERGNTPLVLATQAGNEKLVRALVKLGASVDRANKAANTPLMLAAQAGDIKLVKTLVELGADVNKQSKSKPQYTALALAAQSGHKEIVEFLVKNKAILASQSVNEKNALTWATQSNQLPVVEFLLQAGAQPLTSDNNGKYPVMFAIDNEATSSIKAILKSVAEYSGATVSGSTPLSRDHATQALLYAAEVGKPKACEMLIKHGANVHFMNDKHQTPLSLAVGNGNIEVVEMLLANGAKPNITDLEISIIHNGTAISKLLLKRGADPKGHLDLNKLGKFPLMDSIIYRVVLFQNVEVLEDLLKDHGFNANTYTNMGNSLVGLAVSQAGYGSKQSKIVDCLLAAGADLTYREPGGNTAFLDFTQTYLTAEMFKKIGSEKSAEFHQFMDPTMGVFIRHIKERGLEASVLMPAVRYAVESNNLGLIDVMRQQGLNINQQDINGYTPLMYAVLQNNPQLTHALLQKGADPSISNKSKENALDLAINNDKAESFMSLVIASELKDTASGQNLFIETAFTAVKNGKCAILDKLLENSSNLSNIQDEQGDTLLMHALKKGNLQIVKQLMDQNNINLTLKNDKGETALKIALDSSSEEIKAIITGKIVNQKSAFTLDHTDTSALPHARSHQKNTIM